MTVISLFQYSQIATGLTSYGSLNISQSYSYLRCLTFDRLMSLSQVVCVFFGRQILVFDLPDRYFANYFN